MSAFFPEDYEKLDSKIAELQEELDGLKYTLLTSHVSQTWDTIFDLMKQIQDDFRTVKYPKRQSREDAWQRFFQLRQDAYDKRNERFERVSRERKDEIFDMMKHLEYWRLREGLREMFFTELNTIRIEVIENGRKLNEVGKYFSSVKHQMTADDKVEVFTRIKEIRESHDDFWEVYKDRSRELNEAKDERKRDYEERRERSERAKDSLVENIENNREKLEKAEQALAKQESHKDDLEDKIRNAYSDSYRERHEGWLEECENTISDIESRIDRLKDWIREGEDKLRNWK